MNCNGTTIENREPRRGSHGGEKAEIGRTARGEAAGEALPSGPDFLIIYI